MKYYINIYLRKKQRASRKDRNEKRNNLKANTECEDEEAIAMVC